VKNSNNNFIKHNIYQNLLFFYFLLLIIDYRLLSVVIERGHWA